MNRVRSLKYLPGAVLVAALVSGLCEPSEAEVKVYRVGDAEHPWRLSPVSGLINWGQGWSVEVLMDEDQDGSIDEDPVEIVDNDNDGLFNEDPPEVQIDNDGDGVTGEDRLNGVDDDGDGEIDEDPPESVDNDLDGLFDEDGPDEQIDNDGDGLTGEDGLWTHGDDDMDGQYNEDWADGVDNDGDGLVDEDRYGLMTDFDDDCLRLEDNQFDLSKCNGGTSPSIANEDLADGIDNDGDGAVDEDRLASEREGISSWLAPIGLTENRELVKLLAGRLRRAEFGVGTTVAPTEGPLRREIPNTFNDVRQGGIGRAAFVSYGQAFDGDLFTAWASKEGPGGVAVRPFGYYYLTRYMARPRPTFGDDTPHTFTVYYGTPDQVAGNSQRTNSILVPATSGDAVNEIKDYSFDPPLLQAGVWFQVQHTRVNADRWEIAEVNMFGDGYAQDGYYSSEIIDVGPETPQVRRYEQQWDVYKASDADAGILNDQFDENAAGDAVTWGRVRWRGRRLGNDDGDIRIQFRTGNTLDTHVYLRQLGPGVFDDRDANGNLLEAFAWAKDPVRRAGIEFLPFNELGKDLGDDGLLGWSFWSAPLLFEEGLVDESKPLDEQGILLGIPAQTRYVQFQIYFDSDQHGAVALDWIEFEYDVPLVSKGLVAEVFPAIAKLGEPEDFRYFITPSFGSGGTEGFNRIDIVVPSPETRVTAVKVDQNPWPEIIGADLTSPDPLSLLDPQFTDATGEFAQAVVTDAATGRHTLRLKLPQMNPTTVSGFKPGLDGSVEIEFTTSLFRGAAEFSSSVWNDVGVAAGGTFIPQPTRPGDATGELSTDGYTVVVDEITHLMSDVTVEPNPFSPNRDGENDSAFITFDLFLVTEAIDIRVEIHDLSGRAIRSLEAPTGVAGRIPIEWDGTDNEGNLVPPGIYLYRLTAADDDEVSDRTGTIAVVY
ncbi:MAG: hypothetical protein HN404_09135 [Gemmatimonadetes bacterium]|nr:hypothetical protein [Gemmatimonadota bacterium]